MVTSFRSIVDCMVSCTCCAYPHVRHEKINKTYFIRNHFIRIKGGIILVVEKNYPLAA